MTAKSQLGYKAETTYGTYAVPDHFVEFVRESLQMNRETIKSQGWRAGQRVASALRTKQGRKNVSGTIEAELQSKGLGGLFKAALGTSAITTPGGGTTTRDHTYTLGDIADDFLTVQVGREKRDQTVQAFSYLGCQVTAFHLHCAMGELATVAFDIIGRDEDTAQALAAASYPATLENFSFVEGSLTVDAVSTPIREATIDIDNRLNEDDYAFGSPLRRATPEPALRLPTGSFDADFTDLTAYNRFVNGTVAVVVLLFMGSVIEGAFNYQLEVTMNGVVFQGETPTVDGPEEIRQMLPFECFAPAAGEPISMVYRTTDTAD